MPRIELRLAILVVLIAVAALLTWWPPPQVPAALLLPFVLLIGAAVFAFGRRAVAWPHATTVERVMDVIMFGALIVVSIRADSQFIRITTAVSAAILMIGWLIAWHRHRRR
jgi:hypothetical protein